MVLLKKNNVKGENFDEKSYSSTELVISQESKSFVKAGFYVSYMIAN